MKKMTIGKKKTLILLKIKESHITMKDRVITEKEK